MRVSFDRAELAALRTPLLCLPLYEGEVFQGGALDRATGGALAAVARSRDFTGKLGSQTLVYNPRESGPQRILLIGAGRAADLDLERVRQTAARLARRALDLQVHEAAIWFPRRARLEPRALSQAITEGLLLGEYKYDRYLSVAASKEDGRRGLKEVTLVATGDADRKSTRAGIERGAILGDIVCRIRDMVNAPANELTPTHMAERAAASARAHRYTCHVFEKRDMQKLGMGGLLAVASGSDQPPRFIVLEYNGADRKSPPYVFVGKGLTFDAGGLCLKPAPKMDEMKGDMAGGAAVIGAVEAIARLGLPARVVGLIPATENLLGGAAYRPGDILRMLNGKTVFVDNTDAEGRIILGDALAYAQRYRPHSIVDLATLTGAALVALGQVATAVVGTDRGLLDDLKAAGDRTWERLWELPLWPEFDELIKSPIADIKNSGGKNAGAITAAAFLRQFVGTTPWAHLDIAGTAFLDKAEGYRPAGATGVGVRLLADFVEAKSVKRRAARSSRRGRARA
jgi:leucyl aminopeptidase